MESPIRKGMLFERVVINEAQLFCLYIQDNPDHYHGTHCHDSVLKN